MVPFLFVSILVKRRSASASTSAAALAFILGGSTEGGNSLTISEAAPAEACEAGNDGPKL